MIVLPEKNLVRQFDSASYLGEADHLGLSPRVCRPSAGRKDQGSNEKKGVALVARPRGNAASMYQKVAVLGCSDLSRSECLRDGRKKP